MATVTTVTAFTLVIVLALVLSAITALPIAQKRCGQRGSSHCRTICSYEPNTTPNLNYWSIYNSYSNGYSSSYSCSSSSLCVIKNSNSVSSTGNSRSKKIYRQQTTQLLAANVVEYDIATSEKKPLIDRQKISNQLFDLVTSFAETVVSPTYFNQTQRNLPVVLALQKIQSNMEMLDNVAGRTPQLTRIELLLLSSTVCISAVSPSLFSMKIVELLVPSMAALAAAIGISAEYVGKVAVSNAKEVSALAIQAAAEAEVVLANAERTKAILPLCVGISTTASAFALLAPSLLNEFKDQLSIQFLTEVYLLCPLIAVLAAAVAGLATEEARMYAFKAKGLGTRRFASSSLVGRSWMSATEQVQSSSERLSEKWKSFAIGVAPAPLIGALCPGPLPFKAIVCAAVAAAQAAYYLSLAEYYITDAVEAVALKARSSAIADTYANQSARAGAILPFTSALAGLCAAASAAAVEGLPFLSTVEFQSLLAMAFPSGAALFAAAASVAKARCEVDQSAASEAVSRGLAMVGGTPRDPAQVVAQQMGLAVRTSIDRIVTRLKQIRNAVSRGIAIKKLKRWLLKYFSRFRDPKYRPGNYKI